MPKPLWFYLGLGIVPVAAAQGAATAVASDDAVVFDGEALRRRGLDPALAAYFKNATRFLPGVQWVELQVNGRSRGRSRATFDAAGELCATRSLLEAGHVQLPREPALRDAAQGCIDLVALHPQAQVKLHPATAQVALLLPASALRETHAGVEFQGGGTAAMLNYDLLGLRGESAARVNRYLSASTEAGLNVADTLIRSRQTFTSYNGRAHFQPLQTYAQRTFAEHAGSAQVGQINLLGSAFAGTAFTGAQWFPEAALRANGAAGVQVQGIANGPARVEVRQAGALLHDTLVPAGPFTLPGIVPLDGRNDLQVTVIEEDGQRRSFTLPASALSRSRPSTPGLALAAGKLRTFSQDQAPEPWLLTASQGWALGRDSLLSGGLMASDHGYQAGAFTLGTPLSPETSLHLHGGVARVQREDLAGSRLGATLNNRLSEQLTSTLNWQGQTRDYRDVADAVRRAQDDDSLGRQRQQAGLSLGWAAPRWGSYQVGQAWSQTWNGHRSQHVHAGWSHKWAALSVNLNVQYSLGSAARRDTSAMLGVSLALGGQRNLRGSASQRNGQARLDSSYSARFGQSGHYRVSAAEDLTAARQSFSSQVDWSSARSRQLLGYSYADPSSQSYSGQLAGGLAWHSGGVTFSPQALGDTYLLAKVGELPGVELQTSNGSVWTDRRGHALIARVNPYQPTAVTVQTAGLARHVDIDNSYQAITLGRGSVQRLDFAVSVTRRLLLHITDSQGQALAKGLTLADQSGAYVTSVGNDGKAYLNQYSAASALRVQYAPGQFCEVQASVPEQPDPDAYYETVAAVCVAADELPVPRAAAS